MRDRRVALIGRHVGEPRADRLAPQHRFAGRAVRAEIGGAGDLRTEARDEIAVSGVAVHREDHLVGADRRAIVHRDAGDGAVLDDQLLRAVADRERNVALLDERQQIVDEILAAPRDRRMQPLDRVADVLVGGDELHARAEIVDQPFDGRRRNLGHAPHQFGRLRAAGDRQQVAHHRFRRIVDARRLLILAARGRHRAGRERGIAARPVHLLDDRDVRAAVMGRDGGRHAAGARADDQNFDIRRHSGSRQRAGIGRERAEQFGGVGHVGVFLRHVEQIDGMRGRAAVVDRIVRHRDSEIVRERIDDAAAHASGRRASRHHDRVGALLDQIARERRAEERARMLLRHQDIAVARRDLRDEVVAVRRDPHDGRNLVGQPALVEGLLRRHVRIEHRPVLLAKRREKLCDVRDRLPADLAAGGGKFLDRLPRTARIWCRPSDTARR